MTSSPPIEIHLRPLSPDPIAARRAVPIPLPPRPSAVDSGTFRSAPGPVFEPLFNRQHQPRLLLLFPRETDPVLNGQRAPHTVVLVPGDRVSWTPGEIFAVQVYARPRLGPPPPAAIRRPCPVCRVPLTAEDQCVMCPCGAGLHCALAEDGLQCARVGPSCPVCRRPIVLTEGYIDATPDED